MDKKMTNVKALNVVLDTCANVLPTDVVEKLKAMRDGYSNKSVSKAQLERRTENESVKTIILASVEPGKWYSIPELYIAIPALNGVEHGRVARMVSDMFKAGQMNRKELKGRAMYCVPSDENMGELSE